MVRTFVAAVVASAAFALVLPPQQQTDAFVQRRLQHALQGLDDPLRRGECVRELAWLSRLALPRVQELLAEAETPASQRLLLLQAVTAMGKAAVPALPLCEQLLESRDGRLVRAALTAIAAVAPHAGAAVREALQQRLTAVPAQWSGLHQTVAVVRWRVHWGNAVPARRLVADMDTSNEALLAAAQATAAGCVDGSGGEDARLLARLRPLLEPWMAQPGQRAGPELRNGDCAAAIAAAMRHLGAVETPLMLRALLWHPDPAERLRAVMLLGDAPALPADRQREIAVCLEDEEIAVALTAAGVLGRLGASALPSLGSLLQRHAADGAGALDDACRAAVARIFDGLRRDAGAEAVALLDDVERVCCGGAVDAERPWRGAGVGRQWAQLLAAATGAPLVQSSLLRAAFDQHLRGAEVAAAAASVLTVADQAVWEAALALLAAQGRDAATVATGAESPLLLFLGRRAAHASPRDVHECLAWILAGPDADADELRRQLGSDDARVALRAAVEVATRRPPPTPALTAALCQLAQSQPKLGWNGGLRSTETQLWRGARIVAALQLGASGEVQFVRRNRDLAALVADELLVEEDELPQELQRLQQEGAAAEAAAIERAARDKLLPARGIGPPR